MSRLFARFAGFFSSRSLVGVDKAGNKYYSRNEVVDGILKEKRSVIFKGEEDPTSIPVEWICWLNGQRKKPPSPEEMADLEARRERVKLNIALLKKEEEVRKSRERITRATSKVGGPDLKSFIQQFPASSYEGDVREKESTTADGDAGIFRKAEEATEGKTRTKLQPEYSEPTGSGESYKPGTWQPPM